MTPPLLAFVLDRPGRERLVVDADGRVRYLILEAAHPQWADRVGLFQTQLSSERLEGAEAIARDLVETAPEPRGRIGPVVTAAIGGRDATHPLEGPGQAASDLLSDLIEQVRDHALAMVTFGAEVINEADLRLRWTGGGTAEVDLRLARASCRVAVRTKEAWQSVWASTSATRLALVAAPPGFIDGVNSPARIEPGMTARAMLPGALAEAGVGWDLATVEISGWLDIAELVAESNEESGEDNPFEPDAELPDQWPFRLRAVVAPRP